MSLYPRQRDCGVDTPGLVHLADGAFRTAVHVIATALSLVNIVKSHLINKVNRTTGYYHLTVKQDNCFRYE